MIRFLRTLGVLVLLAVASPVLAAPAASVNLVKQRVAKVNVLRGEFSQDKQVSGFKNPLRSQGRFVLAQDRGVIWTTLKPFPSEVVVTRDRILSRQRDGSSRVELDGRQQPAMRRRCRRSSPSRSTHCPTTAGACTSPRARRCWPRCSARSN